MSSKDIAVSVRGLSKAYTIAHNAPKHTMVGEALMHRLKNPFQKPEKETFWALKDVEFDIKKGDVVGIIGRNGAGKSTLLKILSRITKPTTGQIDLYGRVGSLLEVGTGFHPELTGRENIFLNGAILGMRKREIERQFDAIVDFAGVEQFLDTPVKRYSSGMYVRLAFAVAAHLNPEILIVDEVLAVGDAEFQKKCLGKMQDVAESGRTVLFVSHNMAAVRSLCHVGILLKDGEKVSDGRAGEVLDLYIVGGMGASYERVWPETINAPGNEQACLRAVRILNEEGTAVSQSVLESPIKVEIEYQVMIPGTILSLSLSVHNQEEVYILASASLSDPNWALVPHPVGMYSSRCTIPANFFNKGRYSFSALLVEGGSHVIAQQDKIVSIDMIDVGTTSGNYFGDWRGVVRPLLQWKTQAQRIQNLALQSGR